MKTLRDPFRKSVSVGLSLLLLTLSAAVPVLERSELVHEPVVESEHKPGECPSGHDHTVCTQVGANLSVAADGPDHSPMRAAVRSAASPTVVVAVREGHDQGHRSRAPPLG